MQDACSHTCGPTSLNFPTPEPRMENTWTASFHRMATVESGQKLDGVEGVLGAVLHSASLICPQKQPGCPVCPTAVPLNRMYNWDTFSG